MNKTFHRRKAQHKCVKCGEDLPAGYIYVHCPKCLLKIREESKRRRQATRRKSGVYEEQGYKLSEADRKKVKKLGAWLESIKNSEACKQATRDGRHVNIHLSFLRAAWEEHRRKQ